MKKSIFSTGLLAVATALSVTAQSGGGDLEIDQNMDPNPPVKAGYNLIFSDEFDTFNPEIWDKSTPGDDLFNYDSPDFCRDSKNTPVNASNVLEPPVNGVLHLQVREGEDQNACAYSGAEIKTFDSGSWANPNSPYRHWKVYPNSFVEIRLKVPQCNGVGASFWLYGGDGTRFFEIDVFELNSIQGSVFQSNIHFGKSYNDLTHKQYPAKTSVKDTWGNAVSLSEQFLTFGVAWDETKIEMYLNNEKYVTYNFAGKNGSPYQHPAPFDIRLSTGANSLNDPDKDNDDDPSYCPDLPTLLEVDYVRVFKKVNVNAVSFLSGNDIALCSNYFWGDGENIRATYYPGASYEWESTPFFNFSDNPTDLSICNCVQWWTTVVPGTPVGVYPIKLKVTFPNGYQEDVILNIRVLSTAPIPTAISLYTADNITYYMQTTIAQNTMGYEWSINGGQTWYRSSNPASGTKNIWRTKGFRAIDEPRTINVCVRSYNDCSISPMICRTITIPAICQNCPGKMLMPDDVIVERTSESEHFYRLKVIQSPLSAGYEWSFDETEWAFVENGSDTVYNYFGQFVSGISPFPIYVRAVNSTEITETYEQEITIPSDYYYSVPPNNQGAELSHGENAYADRNAALSSIQEESTMVYAKFVLFNSLGQKMMAGDLDELDINRIREQLPGGIYFLIKQSIQRNQQKVCKLMINR